MNKVSKPIQCHTFVIAGEAGQGIDSISGIISKVVKKYGYNIFDTKEYMSRIRGGCNSTEIRISIERVCCYADKINYLFLLGGEIPSHLRKRISPDTVIFCEEKRSKEYEWVTTIIKTDFPALSQNIGGKIYANTIAAGIIWGICNIDSKFIEESISEIFAKKGEDIANKNINAANEGIKIVKSIKDKTFQELGTPLNLSNEIILNGGEAVSLGCIVGGCNFISAYPMSPGTGVLTYLATQAKDFEIIAEQAEDEIAAINMAIVACYSGARAMTTTSGGGFALQEEGVSLSGMLETPVVIHIGQRPGPATGLPTRTEQGDLDLALYSGHGDFPRIILAPGTLQECFELGKTAFDMADRFQVPVFILTDQYILDSSYNIPAFAINKEKIVKHTVKTNPEYKRYLLTDDGLSPRGIPGYGEGLVIVDSDEHDEEGHITEDLELRIKMVDKRKKKINLILKNSIQPVFTGNDSSEILVVSWGSTFHSITEALSVLNNKNIASLHFPQVYPVPLEAKKYFEKKKKIIVVENNSNAQFAKLLKRNLEIKIDHTILKYNGLPFSPEELIEKLDQI